jgi:hypothetical protein
VSDWGPAAKAKEAPRNHPGRFAHLQVHLVQGRRETVDRLIEAPPPRVEEPVPQPQLTAALLADDE